MHHRRRYQNHFAMHVWFYGENITEREQETAKKLVTANCLNMDCDVASVLLKNSVAELEGQAV